MAHRLGQRGFRGGNVAEHIILKDAHVGSGESPDFTVTDVYKDCHRFRSVHKQRSSLSVCSDTNNSIIIGISKTLTLLPAAQSTGVVSVLLISNWISQISFFFLF